LKGGIFIAAPGEFSEGGFFHFYKEKNRGVIKNRPNKA
jgi:hypothetical protein